MAKQKTNSSSRRGSASVRYAAKTRYRKSGGRYNPKTWR